MKLGYICPVCGCSRHITSFWKWFITPHFGARKYMKCNYCNKIRLFHRWDGMKWIDWPKETNYD